MRAKFFGDSASTHWMTERLKKELAGFRHYDADIRDVESINRIFQEYDKNI